MMPTFPDPGKRWYDADCQRCPRLVGYLREVRSEHPHYHCLPVPPFGDVDARLLIVGLAPGRHGANASGRPFTGDHAGLLLYRMLHQFGYANRPLSEHRSDSLKLSGCRVTNAVKCLPPKNKPDVSEVRNCLSFLQSEISAVPAGGVLLALGALAHGAILRCLGLRPSDHPFFHGAIHRVGEELTLVSSYHCSRYNTQTRRLTEPMFESIFHIVSDLLKE